MATNYPTTDHREALRQQMGVVQEIGEQSRRSHENGRQAVSQAWKRGFRFYSHVDQRTGEELGYDEWKARHPGEQF